MEKATKHNRRRKNFDESQKVRTLCGYAKYHSTLNKLSDENFDLLSDEIANLPISTMPLLYGMCFHFSIHDIARIN